MTKALTAPTKKKKNRAVLTLQCIPAGTPPLLVSKNDARYYLGGICAKTLQKLINNKTLPTQKVLGRTMIPYHALAKIVRKGAHAE